MAAPLLRRKRYVNDLTSSCIGRFAQTSPLRAHERSNTDILVAVGLNAPVCVYHTQWEVYIPRTQLLEGLVEEAMECASADVFKVALGQHRAEMEHTRYFMTP